MSATAARLTTPVGGVSEHRLQVERLNSGRRAVRWGQDIPMPPRGVKSVKRKRQYEHIKVSALERGAGEERAKEIAARTVNKQRRQAGETRKGRSSSRTTTGRRASSGGRTASAPTSRTSKKR